MLIFIANFFCNSVFSATDPYDVYGPGQRTGGSPPYVLIKNPQAPYGGGQPQFYMMPADLPTPMPVPPSFPPSFPGNYGRTQPQFYMMPACLPVSPVPPSLSPSFSGNYGGAQPQVYIMMPADLPAPMPMPPSFPPSFSMPSQLGIPIPPPPSFSGSLPPSLTHAAKYVPLLQGEKTILTKMKSTGKKELCNFSQRREFEISLQSWLLENKSRKEMSMFCKEWADSKKLRCRRILGWAKNPFNHTQIVDYERKVSLREKFQEVTPKLT